MTMTLTDDAKARLDGYLNEVRAALAGNETVDVADVERDVLAHIEAELADAPQPIGNDRLEHVLDALGVPEQWVGTKNGPTSKRLDALSYLTFILFAAAPLLFIWMVLWPLPVVLLGASFVLGRAALALSGSEGAPLGVRSWLIYPPLVAIYALIAIAVLFWPLPMVGGAITDDPDVQAAVVRWLPGRIAVIAPAVAFGVTAIWWITVAALIRFKPHVIRFVFYPFGSRPLLRY